MDEAPRPGCATSSASRRTSCWRRSTRTRWRWCPATSTTGSSCRSCSTFWPRRRRARARRLGAGAPGGSAGRPIDLLTGRDSAGFEDALATLAERGSCCGAAAEGMVAPLAGIFDGFRLDHVEVGDARLHVRLAAMGRRCCSSTATPGARDVASGPPLLVLRFTLVCPDLRGDGGSSKPPTTPESRRDSKRAMVAEHARCSTVAATSGSPAGHELRADVGFRPAMTNLWRSSGLSGRTRSTACACSAGTSASARGGTLGEPGRQAG